MHTRIAATADIQCPRCQAENVGRKIYVWQVADERGPHYECDVCATPWPITVIHVATPDRA